MTENHISPMTCHILNSGLLPKFRGPKLEVFFACVYPKRSRWVPVEGVCLFSCEAYSPINLSYRSGSHLNSCCFSLQEFCFTAFYLQGGTTTACKLPWITVQMLTTVLLMGSLYFYKPVSKLMILKKYV